MTAEFGIIGLGVMGKSLSRNLANLGVKLALYNQRVEGKEENIANKLIHCHSELKEAQGFEDLTAFINSLAGPKKILLMVKAGAVVDAVLDQLLPLLKEGDIVIDGGNSYYKDTERRSKALAAKGLHFVGSGVSGGEEGALKGPAIMPGGSTESYQHIRHYLEAMAAVDALGGKCCAHVGSGGAGHFVKMVHNGIEYAEMQLIAEVYALLRKGTGASQASIADLFEEWIQTDVKSYLLEITIDILRKKEGDDWLLDKILDKAGNKGTGSWTTIAACELGVPVPTISAALFARYQSAFKQERVSTNQQYGQSYRTNSVDVQALKESYQLARIVNHHQGIHLIDAASEANNWAINLSELARIWTNGCIIRSELMTDMIGYLKDSSRLLQHPKVQQQIQGYQASLQLTISTAFASQVPIPCLTASASYLLSYLETNSSANMIQAQRDYFGAHTYQRTDDPTGEFHHTNWLSS